ncbi:MAG: GNAT family N-acetyltransferase [Bacillota bacterium]
MITYKRDYDKTYDATIKTLLREYNTQYSNNPEYDCVYLYRFDQNRLTGALTVDYFWNWAGVKAFYYEDRDTLDALVQEASAYYKDKAMGMKFYTPSLKHRDDFVSVGFTNLSTYTYPDGTPFYFVDRPSLSDRGAPTTGVERHFEPQRPLETLVEKHMASYRKTFQITAPVGTFDVAALHGDACVGGIQCEISTDAMYISRIAVDKAYRNNRIGSTLINKAIDHARRLNLKTIDLGTCEFQGRPFYEKFGFKVIHTREDNPKGYKNYTMIKEL